MTTKQQLQTIKDVEERNDRRMRMAIAKADILQSVQEIDDAATVEAFALVLRYAAGYFIHLKKEHEGGDAK